jgi:hypothetical protein
LPAALACSVAQKNGEKYPRFARFLKAMNFSLVKENAEAERFFTTATTLVLLP